MLFCALACVLQAAPAFTLEQILGSPFPDNLVAQPNGDAVAWVSNAAGVRNVWVARAPEFKPVRVTGFTADDGQSISDLEWKKDGGALAFSRGGSNPLSDPAGPHREIWLASENTAARRIGEGRSPAFSPDGSTLAWISRSQIWTATTAAGRQPGKPASLFEARGDAGDLAWSPDGASLAFTSERGDHSFIGVYQFREKSLRFPDASVDSDQNPSWSPDGAQLCFIRVPAFHDETRWGQSPKPEGQPWSIRCLDPVSGKSRELFHAEAGKGSVFWPLSSKNQLLWTAGSPGADNRVVFPWELDGWQHLYAVPVAGGPPVLLTPGAFEVDQATMSPDRATIVIASNQNDLDRRHLYAIPIGASPRILTAAQGIAQGIEWSPAALSSNRVAFIHSDAKNPAAVAVLINGQMRDLAPVPASFPSKDLIEPKPVLFKSPDGLTIHSQIFLPAGISPAANGKHPAVVFFHGGPRRQMLLGWNPSSYYHRAYAFNQYLASQGYIVLAVNYRSGTGYGTAFREVPHYGATGGVEYTDVLGAAQYLQTRDDVDPARIGLWGGSYGGYLTALGLARNSDLFAAGVDLHGIHDWNLEFPEDLPRPAEVIKTAFESSPLAAIETWRSPVLLIQGDDDHSVAFSQTVRVVEALRRQKVPFEQLIFPDEAHEFLVHSHWLAAYHAADTFLRKYLKP